MARVMERFGDLVFDTVITRTVRFPETSVAGEPITTWAPKSGGAEVSVVGPRGHRPVRRVTGHYRPERSLAAGRLPGPAEQFRGSVRPAAAADLRAPSRRHRGGAAPGDRRVHRLHQGDRPAAGTRRDDRVPGDRGHAAGSEGARLLPSGEVHDEEDLALLEVRDLLFARLLQYRAFKHVAEMFAELEAAALRSYPRSVSLEDRYGDLLPEVMLGVDAERSRRSRRRSRRDRSRWWPPSTCTS